MSGTSLRGLPRGSYAPGLPRLLARMEVSESGCWLWTGYRSRLGYGQIRYQNRAIGTHRLSYMLLVGPIPEGLVIDHLCRTPACINPAHLEPVPQRVNVLRGESPIARQAEQTACGNGHPFTDENTRVDRKGGKRRCRICSRAYYAARRRAEGIPERDPSVCPNGHSLTPENTYNQAEVGRRRCIQCHELALLRRYLQRKSA